MRWRESENRRGAARPAGDVAYRRGNLRAGLRGRAKSAGKVREQFGKTADIVAIDDSVTEAAPKLQVQVMQSKAALLGVSPRDIVDVISMALSGQDVASLHDENAKYAPPLRIGLPAERRSNIDEILKLKVRARDGVLVPLSEVVQVIRCSAIIRSITRICCLSSMCSAIWRQAG